jgi:pimeloyl-ACP methyl ester carboxylesterase
LTAMGWDVFLAEYRGYGGSAGAPRLGAMLDDVVAIVEAVGVPPEQVVVFGRSVGSLFAIEAVHRFPTLAGLVLESSIADVHQRLRMRVEPAEMACSEDDLRAAVAARLDHRTKLGGYRGPTLTLHAEGDFLVPIDHGERNHAWAGGAQKTLVRFPRGDHNSIFAYNQGEYLRHLEGFLSGVHPGADERRREGRVTPPRG